MRKSLAFRVFLMILGLLATALPGIAQSYSFQVQNQGIYKISASQAKNLGFSSLTELSIYGIPGMLPQKLDSAQLELEEIPALQVGDYLYFFLSGPNTVTFSPEGLNYSHHLFSDSLSFLLAKHETPKRITEIPAEETSADPNQLWYHFTTSKEEKTNLLNSGRAWYSPPIRQGQSLNINLNLRTETVAPWLLHGKVMAHSFSGSTMRVLEGNKLLGELAIDAIPNSTYGIKGREQVFNWEIDALTALPQLRFTFQGNGSESAGYLDYVVIGVPFANSELTAGIYEAAEPANLSLPTHLHTWEVSDFYHPKAIDQNYGESSFGKKWVIFDPATAPEIRNFESNSLELRNLSGSPELLIITSESLLSSANKLKGHKASLGTETMVVTDTQVYQSFGYGNPDLTAIRNFIAAVFHAEKTLKNVLILGKGTFDYKRKLGGRPNLVSIYTSRESLNPLNSFSSDDYFGLVDFGQGEWLESRDGDELMQIGVGRLPAINYSEANEMVEKIIRYETHPIRTPKSLTYSFLVDDGDNNIHIRDAEAHSGYLSENHPEVRLNKLYLDRYDQEISGDTQSSGQAKSALQQTLDDGTMVLNFIGHGNETTLTAEEIFRVEDLANWQAQEQPALWITATCEFGRHDSPFIRSAAEELLAAKAKGAIALLTTGRPVFSSVNFSLNKAFVEAVFQKNGGQYPDLGTIYRHTKNNSLNGALNRNFALLGDPSLQLALPELGIRMTALEDSQTGSPADTLSPLREIRLKAEIVGSVTQTLQPGFSGEFQVELRDKPIQIPTHGDESAPYDFEEENILLFKGQGKVSDGRLEAKLMVPMGIKPDFGKGRLRITAWDTEAGLQAMGSYSPVIGGDPLGESGDQSGPEIQLIINGQETGSFLFSSPNLAIKGLISDESGINVSSQVPAHSLRIQVNEQPAVILSEDFVAEGGSFQKGSFETFLKGFEEGKNKITVHAWDMAGNESILIQEVEIRGSDQLQILAHKVYPNPATSESNFELTHNRAGENLKLNLAVFSTAGQILFSEDFRLLNANATVTGLSWPFLKSQTNYPAKGTYIYKLSLLSELDSTSDSVSGKLVIQ